MRCRKGPTAVRIGHTATFASLDLGLRRLAACLRKQSAGAKTQGLGPRPSSDCAGAWHLLKNSKSAFKLLRMMVPALPRMPKRVLAFEITPNTRTATHGRTTSLVLLPGSSLASFAKSSAARRNQDMGPRHRQTEVGGRNGTWDAAGGRQERDLGHIAS
jgi:hypothetical protein